MHKLDAERLAVCALENGHDLPQRAEFEPEDAIKEYLAIVIRIAEAVDARIKLLCVFHLFEAGAQRFSELERLIPSVTQKMLIQQLKALEADGVVRRKAHPVVPPHVEYQLTDLGAQLKPALEALRDWSGLRSTRLVLPQT